MKNLIVEYANRKYPICGDYDKYRYGNDRMNEYIVKSTAGAVLLDSGLILGFDKLSVKKDFYFPDEGVGLEICNSLSDTEKRKKYFMRENLAGITKQIESLQADNFPWFTGFYDNDNGTAELATMNYNQLTSCGIIEEGLEKHEKIKNWHHMKESDRKKCVEVLRKIKADFEKRLESYWKKYAQNIRTHTYWADR